MFSKTVSHFVLFCFVWWMEWLFFIHELQILEWKWLKNGFLSSQLSNRTTEDREWKLIDVLAVWILHECKPVHKKKNQEEEEEEEEPYNCTLWGVWISGTSRAGSLYGKTRYLLPPARQHGAIASIRDSLSPQIITISDSCPFKPNEE